MWYHPGVDQVEAFAASRRSPATAEAYLADLRLLALFLRREPYRLATTLRTEHVASWRDAMLEAGLSPSTVRRRLAAVRAFGRWLQISGKRRDNPAALVESPPLPSVKASTSWVEAPDAASILEAPDQDPRGLRDRAMLALLFRVGLRRAEVLALRRGSIERDPRGPGVVLRVLGKRGRRRDLAIGDVWPVLEAHLAAAEIPEDPEAVLFPSPTAVRDGAPLTGRYLHRIVAGYAAQVGARVRDGASLSPHGARRTYATIALDRGISIEDLRRAMGHTTTSTTARYDLRSDAAIVLDYRSP